MAEAVQNPFKIVAERPEDSVLIDPLLDRTFGLARRQRTVYRLRDGIAPIAALSRWVIPASPTP